MSDKEDNVMSYGCLHSHRSYIVMDLLTCGACLGSFASQKIALSRDIAYASKIPNLLSCHESPQYVPMD